VGGLMPAALASWAREATSMLINKLTSVRSFTRRREEGNARDLLCTMACWFD